MANKLSPGARFRKALKENQPLQIVGTINAYAAMMAERVGHQAIYLSGGGVANASYGLPDLGMTTMNDVVEDVRRITAAVDVPLLVDIDTGWGGAFNIARTIREMERAGAAAVHSGSRRSWTAASPSRRRSRRARAAGRTTRPGAARCPRPPPRFSPSPGWRMSRRRSR